MAQETLFDITPDKTAASVEPSPDPECDVCGGAGWVQKHSPWCKNPHCTLSKQEGDCHGSIKRCKCAKPKKKKKIKGVDPIEEAAWSLAADILLQMPDIVPDASIRGDVAFSWRALKVRAGKLVDPLTEAREHVALSIVHLCRLLKSIQHNVQLSVDISDGIKELIKINGIVCLLIRNQVEEDGGGDDGRCSGDHDGAGDGSGVNLDDASLSGSLG